MPQNSTDETTNRITSPSISPRSNYEPLSIQDRVFLALEKPGAHMHVTATCIFEGGPLVGADGGVDLHRLREHFMSSVATFPRYRQRLARVPLDRAPVWVDDERFDLDYHLRYARLTKAADDASLKHLCSDLVSRPLERDRPLWEVWVVEGLERRRFALVTKVHHAVADGVAGMDLLASLLQTAADAVKTVPEPRPAPTPVELLRAEALRRAQMPWSWLQQTTAAIATPSASISRVARAAFAMWDALGAGLRRAPATPLNLPIGSERRFDWLTMELDDVKDVKNRLGGTVNDVILAVVAGALRRFLERRRVRVDDLRALVPVNLRTPSQGDAKGNHVTAWLVDLPMCERDPLRRHARIRQSTERLRASSRAVEGESLTSAGMWALQFAGSLVGALRPFNVVVTNVAGPSTTLDLLGARLVHAYPQAPLLSGQALGIALFSYDGTLCWGFNADYELLPDLDLFTEDVAASFDELRVATELLEKARERRLEVVTHAADGSTAVARPQRAPAYHRNERRRSVAAS